MKAEAALRLRDAVLDGRAKFLLASCLERYFPLTRNEEDLYDRLRVTDDLPEVTEMPNIFIERATHKERFRIARVWLEKRFGPLSDALLDQLWELDMERLDDIIMRVLDAPSLADLGLAAE